MCKKHGTSFWKSCKQLSKKFVPKYGQKRKSNQSLWWSNELKREVKKKHETWKE